MTLGISNLSLRLAGNSVSVAPIITATTAPVMGALTDAQVLADETGTDGVYDSTAGTPIATLTYQLWNGSSWVTTVAAPVAGDEIRKSVSVTDNVGTPAVVFTSASITVTLAAGVAPSLVGGSTGTWGVQSGEGTATLDLTGVFAGDNLSYSITHDGENIGDDDLTIDGTPTLTLDANVPAAGDIEIVVSASNIHGSDAVYTVTLTVSAFTPAALFTANPSWDGDWYLPSDLSAQWQNTAGDIAVTTDLDTVLRVDGQEGNYNFKEYKAGEDRVYNDDTPDYWDAGTNKGVFALQNDWPTFGLTTSEFFLAGAMKGRSNGVQAVMAEHKSATSTINFSARVNTSDNPQMVVPTTGAKETITNTSVTMAQTGWSIYGAGIKDAGATVLMETLGESYEETLTNTFAPFTPNSTNANQFSWGGSTYGNTPRDNYSTTGPFFMLSNAMPTSEERNLISLWLAENSLPTLPRPSFLVEPSLTGTAGQGETITINTGTAATTADPTTKTVGYYWNGADVSGDVSGTSYVIPSEAGQFAMIVELDNGLKPTITRVVSVEVDMKAAVSGTADTVSASKWAHNGVLFEFSTAVNVSQYLTGPSGGYPAVQLGAATVTYRPAAEVSDDANTRNCNGAMMNPPAGTNTGLDSYHGDYYRSSLNVGFDGALSMSAGDILLVAPSDMRKTNEGRESNKSKSHAYLTCVSSAPFFDELRPPLTWETTSSKPTFRLSDGTLSTLAQIDTSSITGLPSSASAEGHWKQPFSDFSKGFPRDQWVSGSSVNLYSRVLLSTSDASLTYFLSDSVSEADKKMGFAGFLQAGVDRLGIMLDWNEQGSDYCTADGGHNAFRKFNILAACDFLGYTAKDAAIAANDFHEDYMTNYVTQAYVDMTPNGTWDPAYTGNVTRTVASSTGFSAGDTITGVTSGGKALIDSIPDGTSIRLQCAWGTTIGDEDVTNGTATTAMTGTLAPNSDPYQQGMVDGGTYPMPEWNPKNPISARNAKFDSHPYRFVGNHEWQWASISYVYAMGLKTAWGHDAFFDYQLRHWHLRSGFDDPWRFQGGTALYNQVAGITTKTFTSPGYQAYVANIGTWNAPPWGGTWPALA